MTVPDSYRRQAVAALGVDPLDAQIRQVYFFDTPDLALNGSAWSPGHAGCRGGGTTRWSS